MTIIERVIISAAALIAAVLILAVAVPFAMTIARAAQLSTTHALSALCLTAFVGFCTGWYFGRGTK